MSKSEIEDKGFARGVQYKNHIGKMLPLSYVVTEIENYLESAGRGDFLVLVSRDSFPAIEEKSENGIPIITARSNSGTEFVVFYKAKFNKFGLFLKKQTGKDTFEYFIITAWDINVEEGSWFDLSVQVPGDNSLY